MLSDPKSTQIHLSPQAGEAPTRPLLTPEQQAVRDMIAAKLAEAAPRADDDEFQCPYDGVFDESEQMRHSDTLRAAWERNRKGGEWQDPVEVRTTLLPVEPMTEDMLPEPVRDWLADIAHRMRCPLDYAASAFVTMISSLIGTRLSIKPKQRDDWTVVPNLWGAAIGDPSMLKTPSIAEVFKPLNRLVADAREQHEAAMLEYEGEAIRADSQKRVYQEQQVNLIRGKAVTNPVSLPQQPKKPTEKRRLVNDATVEKLGALLNENPAGLLMFRDELTGLLASWDKMGREEDRAFYLEAWNGNGGKIIDRIGSGTLHVPYLCVSLFGGIQPAKLLGYLQAATGYENDGFVQRLQVAVFPDKPQWDYIDQYPDKDARDRAFEIIKLVAESDFAGVAYQADDYNRFPYVHFDTDAQQVFRDWMTRWHTEILPNETGLLLEHFSKYPSLMPSLALVFHLLDYAAGVTQPDAASGKHLVSEKAALLAVRWCGYLQSHARRIYGLLDTAHVSAAKELLKHLRAGDLPDGFKARDVQRKGWSLLKDGQQVEGALGELVRLGWLKQAPADAKTGGRPESAPYRMHPKLLQNA